jgi:hypothetical protein
MYCEMFEDEPAQVVAHGCEKPIPLPKRGVELGGAVDLLLRDSDGHLVLRQLELWNRELAVETFESWELTLALLRLRQTGAVQGPLRVVHADLNSGQRVELEVDLASEPDGDLMRLARKFDTTYQDIQSRVSMPIPEIGLSCGFCNKIGSCDEWSHKLPLPVRLPTPSPYVGRVVHLTPSSVETWTTCPRWFRARYVLTLPGWPIGPNGRLGLLVHERLALLHEAGPCSVETSDRLEEAASVDGVINQEVLNCIERHAERCPQGANSIGHELSLSELLVRGKKAAMVSARIDGVWSHSGILDCRDYKTGQARVTRVQDDVAARVQAFVLAPLATRLGLRLRLRYEFVGSDAEDPEPFEPEDDDIEAIADELAAIALQIAESDFLGDPDPLVCTGCPYQLACPDSAADHDIEIEVVDLSDMSPLPLD